MLPLWALLGGAAAASSAAIVIAARSERRGESLDIGDGVSLRVPGARTPRRIVDSTRAPASVAGPRGTRLLIRPTTEDYAPLVMHLIAGGPYDPVSALELEGNDEPQRRFAAACTAATAYDLMTIARRAMSDGIQTNIAYEQMILPSWQLQRELADRALDWWTTPALNGFDRLTQYSELARWLKEIIYGRGAQVFGRDVGEHYDREGSANPGDRRRVYAEWAARVVNAWYASIGLTPEQAAQIQGDDLKRLPLETFTPAIRPLLLDLVHDRMTNWLAPPVEVDTAESVGLLAKFVLVAVASVASLGVATVPALAAFMGEVASASGADPIMVQKALAISWELTRVMSGYIRGVAAI